MADVYFRPQRLAGDGVYADFVPNLAGIVQASGAVTAQPASTTGQIETHADVVVTGVVTGQPSNTTGVTNTITPETATGAVTGQEAATTGQILAVAPTPVDVTGTVQGQSAIASGIVVVEAASYATATGDSKASPATTTGQILSIGSATATGAVQAQPATTTGKSGLFKDHSPELLMKLPDGTWIPINDDMHWIYSGFIDGTTYLKNDTLREAGWTMIANKQTTDYPAPEAIGSPFDVYDGTLTPTSVLAKVVIYGNRYTFANDAYLSSYRVDTTIGNDYEIFMVRDPLGAAVQTRLATFTATITGWTKFTIEPAIVLAGSVFDLIAVTNEPDATPTPVTLSYNYLTPQNPANPATGTISHSRSQSDVMQVSYTDQNGDQTATISNLSAGDTIEGAGMAWTITANVPDTGFATLTVTPAATGAPTGIQDFLFNTTTPTQIEYGFDTDYWLTSTYNAQGLLAIDSAYADITPNDTAYGTDITGQLLTLSEDWDVVTPGESTGGTASQVLTRSEVSWVQANTEGIDYSDVMTSGNTWTTMGVITLPVDTGFRARSLITARRTDGFGIYHAEAIITAINDGGSVSAGDSVTHEFETSAALDTRVNISGSTVEFQVKGQPGQDWHWMAIIFNREIT